MNTPSTPKGGKFEIGKQPCSKYTPQQTEYGDNVHDCFCGQKEGKNCGGTVSFCLNCHTDHHENGYEHCVCQNKTLHPTKTETMRERIEEEVGLTELILKNFHWIILMVIGIVIDRIGSKIYESGKDIQDFVTSKTIPPKQP